jgi:hypothetical protein
MRDEASKRPVFDLEGHRGLSSDDAYTRRDAPKGQLTLSGPAPNTANGTVPLRGDLAHVRLAGRWFVPHYAVPMPHHAGTLGAVMRASPAADGEEVCLLEPGAGFDVLDIAGGWCWGETREDGPVGYIEQVSLEADAP